MQGLESVSMYCMTICLTWYDSADLIETSGTVVNGLFKIIKGQIPNCALHLKNWFRHTRGRSQTTLTRQGNGQSASTQKVQGSFNFIWCRNENLNSFLTRWVQKRIVAAATIWGNMVFDLLRCTCHWESYTAFPKKYQNPKKKLSNFFKKKFY